MGPVLSGVLAFVADLPRRARSPARFVAMLLSRAVRASGWVRSIACSARVFGFARGLVIVVVVVLLAGLTACRATAGGRIRCSAPPLVANGAAIQAGCRRRGRPGSTFRRGAPRRGLRERGVALPCMEGWSHVRNRRRRRAHAGQPAALRRAAAAAAPRPGRGRHRHRRRRDVPHAQGQRHTCATSSAPATCAISLGTAGIGHCRYPTAGSAPRELEAQPFYVNSPFGIVLAHNGNLTNSEALKQELFQLDFRHVNTNSDSEVLLNVLALELERARAPRAPRRRRDLRRGGRRASALRAARTRSWRMIAGYGLLAFRDPFGIRPLIIGVNEAMGGPRVPGGERVRGARGTRLPGAARRRAGRGDLHRPGRALPCAPVRRASGAHAVHLRVRLPRPAGFGDRRHVGLRGAAAHGRAARAEDPRACRRRATSTS